ncbi:uncharacterized protein LOC120010074 [Tripterygium wilfordii]|uniref:uncharacterized protein LOC120010074 n=1 Tax=Tripterygium wilfordii TaxID=458696 RepID=UPI0018F861D5|nr:uncharacterized protein LOC120010074 [Tripterygium wilfordii]
MSQEAELSRHEELPHPKEERARHNHDEIEEQIPNELELEEALLRAEEDLLKRQEHAQALRERLQTMRRKKKRLASEIQSVVRGDRDADPKRVQEQDSGSTGRSYLRRGPVTERRRHTPSPRGARNKSSQPSRRKRHRSFSPRIRMKKDTGEVLWSAQKKAEQSLRKMTSTPFVRALRLEDPPNKFSHPTFAIYDGKTDPVAHISAYTHKMVLWAGRDGLMCKMFSSSLGTTAMKWFHQLPENSVSSWRELAQIFVARFIANSRDPATLDTLCALHLRRRESLRAYTARYSDTYAGIEDCDERTAVATFRLGLPRDYKLRESLTMAPPKSMVTLQDRINQYVKLEEDKQGDRQFASQEGTKKENKKFEKKNGKEKDSKKDPKPTSYEAVKTIFKDPIFLILPQIVDKPYFRWPNKMSGDSSTRNQSKWCSYHKDKGHRTEDCREFKRHLEELVQQGHLKEFIDKEKTAAEKKAEPQSKERGEPSHYVVNFIDTMVPDALLGDEIRRTEYRRVRHQQEVMRMDFNPHLGRPREATAITFTKEDATGVIFRHNDALVISLQIRAATVKRMMVD